MDALDALGTLGLTVGLILSAGILGFFFYSIVSKILTKIESHVTSSLSRFSFKHCRKPVALLVPVVLFFFLLKGAGIYLPESVIQNMDQLLHISLVVGIAWFLIKLADVAEGLVLSQYNLEAGDNLRARKIHTQMQMVKKILTIVMGILGFAVILMSFEKSRELGAGILASAGLAGLIMGFAAQRTLANIMAGIQLAITQPIRIDDVVVVEGEWGRIEEISLTYVVVRIWDLRRLILPISYFMEKPFQNWTRVSSQILGTVYLHVDFAVPIQAVRNELHRILKHSEYWDGSVWRLHTTEAGDKVVQLRALMSSPDSSSGWELRCEVREKLIEFIRENYPDSLPRVRASLFEQPR